MKLILTILFIVLAVMILAAIGWQIRYDYIPGFLLALCGFDILAILANAFFVPIIAYLNMWKVANEKFENQREELSKYNWDKIDFKEVPYHITGITGWAFRVTNNKPFDFDRIEIRWMQIQTNQEVYSFQANRKAYYFPIIDYENDNMGFYDEDKSLKRGESKDFAITGLENPSTVYKFTTAPKQNGTEWPFKDLSEPPYPEVVIDIRILANIKYDGEISILPIKTILIEVNRNGSLSINR